MTVVIRREEITSPVASDLITALNGELTGLYPEPGATHFRLDPDEVARGRGGFFVAHVDGTPLGCGAVRCLDSATAEIKRMYVASAARGKGIGRAILERLEQEARALGARRLVLETGIRQEAALALYRNSGFDVIPAFGEYTGTPTSICMGKDM